MNIITQNCFRGVLYDGFSVETLIKYLNTYERRFQSAFSNYLIELMQKKKIMTKMW